MSVTGEIMFCAISCKSSVKFAQQVTTLLSDHPPVSDRSVVTHFCKIHLSNIMLFIEAYWLLKLPYSFVTSFWISYFQLLFNTAAKIVAR